MSRRALALVVVAGAITLVAAVVGVRAGSPPAGRRDAVVPSRSGPSRSRVPIDAGAVTNSPRPVPVDAVAPLADVSPPTTVDIPAIGVHSDLERLHLDADGTLQAPASFARAGWYADGPTPGGPGPAVIAGHVDSRSGPAVFFRLDRLRPGDEIRVRRRDGRTAVFVVTDLERYPKARFPDEEVYAPTPGPELRLITCSGAFDRAAGHYVDNTVVSAELRATT